MGRDQARRGTQAVAFVPEVKLAGSGSVIDVPLSTAKFRALLRLRSSPLKDSGSRRLAEAAPRQVVCCVHAGNESDLIRRAQTSIAEPYETTR